MLIAHSFYRLSGGEDRYVLQQADLLRPHHEVEVMARSNESLGANLSTGAKMLFSSRTLRAVEERIDRFAPDIIHLHNPYPALGPAVHLAATARGVPLVQTIHNLRLRCPNGLMFTEGSSCRRCESGNYTNAVLHHCFPTRSQAAAYAGALWSHRFVLGLDRRVRAFIAPSEFVHAQLRSWGFPEGRVWTARNFVASARPTSSVLGDYGMYVGRLSGEKGLGVLLQALALAGDPPFRIVGDGPLHAELVERSARLGLRRAVFTGRLDPPAVAQLMSETRFLIMPSLCEENAPLAVLECMAGGRPVLVSASGGLPELVRTGGGLTFRPGDAGSMANRMHPLLTDDELCIRLGRGAGDFVSQQLSPREHRRTLEHIYRRVGEAS